MDLLTLVIGVPAYVVIGRLLGKLTIRELKRETPSKELNIFQRGVRLLLFPGAYWEWENRMCSITEIDNPLEAHMLFCVLERTGKRTHDGDKPIISYVASGEESYYRIITFLWPFKLIRAFFGAIEIAFFVTAEFARRVAMLPYLAEAPFRRLKNGRAHIEEISAGSDLQKTVQAAWEQFEEQRRQLGESKTEVGLRLAKLGKALIRCRKRLCEGDGAVLSERFHKLETLLTDEIRNVEEQQQQVAQALAFFEGNQGQLEEMRELLDVYTDIHSARLDMEADRQNTLSMIFATQAACTALFRKVSDAERSAMVHLDMDIDEIADSTAENEEAADDVERRLLV